MHKSRFRQSERDRGLFLWMVRFHSLFFVLFFFLTFSAKTCFAQVRGTEISWQLSFAQRRLWLRQTDTKQSLCFTKNKNYYDLSAAYNLEFNWTATYEPGYWRLRLMRKIKKMKENDIFNIWQNVGLTDTVTEVIGKSLKEEFKYSVFSSLLRI